MRALAAVGLAVAVAAWGALGLGAGSARADGDPASDALLSQAVFVPYSGISGTLERRLFALCATAERAGYPVKIALIASKTDLGVVPALFNRPQAYARFLSAELGGVVNGPVLVVMPAGLGLATQGRALSAAAAASASSASASAASASATSESSASAVGSGGPDALATAALDVVPRLARAAGHPLATTAAAAAPEAGASPGTVRHAVTALLVLALLSAAAISAAFVARSRRAAGPRRAAPR